MTVGLEDGPEGREMRIRPLPGLKGLHTDLWCVFPKLLCHSQATGCKRKRKGCGHLLTLRAGSAPFVLLTQEGVFLGRGVF